jgi:hypothetical protein
VPLTNSYLRSKLRIKKRNLVVEDDVEERTVHVQPAVVFQETQFGNLFMKKLTRDRVVPIISASVS